jgi:hypothetical protein
LCISDFPFKTSVSIAKKVRSKRWTRHQGKDLLGAL